MRPSKLLIQHSAALAEQTCWTYASAPSYYFMFNVNWEGEWNLYLYHWNIQMSPEPSWALNMLFQWMLSPFLKKFPELIGFHWYPQSGCKWTFFRQCRIGLLLLSTTECLFTEKSFKNGSLLRRFRRFTLSRLWFRGTGAPHSSCLPHHCISHKGPGCELVHRLCASWSLLSFCMTLSHKNCRICTYLSSAIYAIALS